MFTCALACAHLCACVRSRNRRVRKLHACARLHIIVRIRSKHGGNIIWVTESCMGYLISTCTLACAHYEHMCAVHFRTNFLQTWCNILRGTDSCMGYLIYMCALACARYAHACTHMRACVRSHIFGRIRPKFGGNIPLHGLHDLCMCSCVCTLCAL
jgi:hypothetical protein